MPLGSSLVTTTATGSARCTSTPWKGSGRCCGRGSAPPGDLAGAAAAVPGLLRVRAQRPKAWQGVAGVVDRTPRSTPESRMSLKGIVRGEGGNDLAGPQVPELQRLIVGAGEGPRPV